MTTPDSRRAKPLFEGLLNGINLSPKRSLHSLSTRGIYSFSFKQVAVHCTYRVAIELKRGDWNFGPVVGRANRHLMPHVLKQGTTLLDLERHAVCASRVRRIATNATGVRFVGC